ncbi:hypothetical protein [Roseimaritima ulvae]|uniref:DUF4064 domain-containing protein n=1 Tax=Roseimaritima ulvae TaxID=980254 RepID=A0A5B9QXZ9_9BACT|nr:hypothetical protein [Roseimaritima ulvae]QEG42275.1 hypothetical protein UC8_43090 [Roseimaritima ulvae]
MDPQPPPSNPYATTQQAGFMPPDASQPHYSAIVQQMMPYGILMMVNGGLFALLGLFMVAMPALALTMAEGGDLDDQETMIIIAVYGGMGLLMLIGAALQLWGGWRAIHFRGMAWVIVGIASAAMGSLTCYCAPTGIALGIWGLILLLNPDIQHAFRMGKTESRDKIMQHFSYRGDQWTPPPGSPPPGSPPSNYPPPGGGSPYGG